MKNANGTVRARADYRGADGRSRTVQRTGKSEAAAARLLKHALSSMSDRIGSGVISPNSTIAMFAEIWLRELEIDDGLSEGTLAFYRSNVRNLILPSLGGLRIVEMTVGRCDIFLKEQALIRKSRRRQAKNVLSQMMGLAVRHDALHRNPVRETARVTRSNPEVRSLTEAELGAVRAAVQHWREDATHGPKNDPMIARVFEVLLGSALRIGEVFALRKCDVDVTVRPALVRVSGTIVTPPGQSFKRQEAPKTRAGYRTIALPEYSAEAVRQQLIVRTGAADDAPLFAARNGNWRSP